MNSGSLNRNKVFVAILFLIAATGLADSLHAGMKTDEPWYNLETRSAIINYNSPDSLDKFNELALAEYDIAPTEEVYPDFFKSHSINRIAAKVDGIYSQVQNLLGLQRQLPKVNITIYANRNQLNDAYLKLFGKKRNIRAWYVFMTNTIYINAEDAHAGVLAHEFAHSIIDGHLLVPASSATAEALAQYVERTLLDSSLYAEERLGGTPGAPPKITTCAR